MGGAEIAFDVFFCVSALLRADYHHALLTDFSKATDHGFVFGKKAVAMQLMKVGKRGPQVIESERTAWVPGQLDALPRGQITVDLAACFLELFFHPGDFLP